MKPNAPARTPGRGRWTMDDGLKVGGELTVERRPWGYFETLAKGEGWLFKRLVVQPRKRLSLQYHIHRAEHWVVVRGAGSVQIGQRREAVQPGSTVTIAVKELHRIENTDATKPLEFLEIQVGAVLSETDIVRVEDDYGRIS